MLYQARVESYLEELGSDKLKMGSKFGELVEKYPAFIDGYIEYWKYLKFRLTLIQKTTQQKTNEIEDDNGEILIERMRDVAECALYYSDCTQVPTSLWVEARLCYAKQMVYEGLLTEAIEVLRDICFIIPPMPLSDLSYNQDQSVFSKKAGDQNSQRQAVAEKIGAKKLRGQSMLDDIAELDNEIREREEELDRMQ